ncbi:unnamed protein product [Ambrosiozyma monospora]|uniref:Unnamed protein product n=1 Tax=Ambrosiozyma monospora TaxID=43982 RepID=A0ACB5T5E5_AMBMO|nr:unnamed protein product [Ambrosiozyma monospora]
MTTAEQDQVIVEQLPPEIQHEVAMFTIWNSLTEGRKDSESIDEDDYVIQFRNQFDTRLLRRPICFLYELCDYDELLDSIVVSVIKDLVFDANIIDSPIFKDFVNFIDKKSFEIHMVSTNEIPAYVNDETCFF